MAIFHEHMHDTHRCQIRNQEPGKWAFVTHISDARAVNAFHICQKRKTKELKSKKAGNLGQDKLAFTFKPAIVVPYSLYNSKHILGTSLSSIFRYCNMNSTIKTSQIAHILIRTKRQKQK